ncbi:Stp1/IreP family PP2C-type Ser/Thr phosphatase [Weissella cibaria]|uniref:Stp1/IreP family PP2C-type Ser/Thr phosphatase n=1 Tax=Weissella cibaria TaxID=137591 RepID=A0A9Q8JJ60_9LACO|nr:Stp1/IreP family PP2C-type Ser/Thr phosphatase [Weissella cibaria]QDG80450.1 Stp1/IreP family PP2C-type Ser/Thr phosphatase [Weissella cibaria]QMU89391.1 Stp1/IreP family PP2C-type Ser/Thr phosphatase [Weissella cibaria]TVV27816.1 Stp1/IreP family PP2C-type Ser/Thr phosphatase [Weissella cibaria]TVV36457.1 Stp1/IreP family PP2C-type Ser/Thr phosphatase [Weissella cibaria]TVV41008.1 Stp1/IreP family PP2C-type Ser/Thr phosphatase [Weissella cibaria]
MKIAYASDTGRVRADNQDYVGVFINQTGAQLAIVADGVGGENGGDVAATMAVSHIGNEWQQTDVHDIWVAKDWMLQQTAQENETILKKANRYRTLRGMATTLVVAVILAEQVVIANLGDSRAYLIRDDEMRQLTVDHNLASELLQRGAITADEAVAHPGRHVITRQLGATEEANPDVFEFATRPGDLLVLTTDGMPKHVSDAKVLATILASDNLTDAVASLIAQTNDAGGSDNVTVLIGQQESEDR